MCLLSITSQPKTADRDIVCWKLLFKWGNKHYTPFKGAYVSQDVLDGVYLFEPNEAPYVVFDEESSCFEIKGGYIHTYGDLGYAMSLIRDTKEKEFGQGITAVLYMCIIPTGTEYFESGTSTFLASRAIRFIAKVDF